MDFIILPGFELPDRVEISIRDSGPGIPPNHTSRIFDRFFQATSADTREYEGSGIGLALTHELVEISRGEIRVESEPGKGSMFTVVLPVSRDNFSEDELISIVDEKIEKPSNKDEVESPFTRQSQDGRNKPVILVVEDHNDLRNYIKGILEDKFLILEAENGREGLNCAIEETPDLVITDLMMPEMNGIELCSHIRKDLRTNHIPIIMLTAKADKASKLEGLETGADDYLIKPFDADELKVRVNNLIQQRRKLRERYRKEFLKSDPFTREMPLPEDDFLSRVVECILNHIDEHEFGVEQLASEIGFSRSQLHRKIRSLTGYVPNTFMRNIRLKQAARMFQEGHTNVTQVLYSVGFNTPSHFSKCFRELYGLNPSEYLSQNREKS